MNRPTRLQLGTSRLENLSPDALRVFLDKSWIHFGDAPADCFWLRREWRRYKLARRRIHDPQSLYNKTNFKVHYFKEDFQLPFETGSFTYIFSEHFFEHLFFDDALKLFRECARVLVTGGVMRVSVPDADLRTYEPPEPAGFPSKRLPFTHPNKHKTRWSVYMLGEALRIAGLEPIPIRYCDRDGRYIKQEPRPRDDCPDPELVKDLSYLQRPNSLIVDAIKCGS